MLEEKDVGDKVDERGGGRAGVEEINCILKDLGV